MKKSIVIITEAGGDVGLGHVVRMGHLARALRQKGHEINIWTNEAGQAYFAAKNIDSAVHQREVVPSGDIVIVDFMHNDDSYLYKLRPYAKKLVVIVGVGWTITPTTRWIADLVVYHTPEDEALYGWTPGENVLQGTKWIMMNPKYAEIDITSDRPYEIVTYFGGGINKSLTNSIIQKLKDYEYVIRELGNPEDYWEDRPHEPLRLSEFYVGSMGMMAYEAIVTKTYPIVLCRSEEHAEDANRLAERFLACNLGMPIRPTNDQSVDAYAQKIDIRIRNMRARKWDEADNAVKHGLDGKGLYRVAREILKDA